jgi:hypothetical protein
MIIVISVFIYSNGELLSSISLKHNSSNQGKIIARKKIKMDMRRIRHTLEPVRSLFNSRDVYQKHYNMLKTFWTCCREQRIYMFDIGDIHRTLTGRANCRNFIRDNKNRLTSQCKDNLRLFDPTRDAEICDGRLLRNMVDKHAFAVELSNYTERYCTDGLYPMIIYFNITQIIQCEQDIRQRLRNNPQGYYIYDALSSILLQKYVHNINNYRACGDPHYWDKDEEEDDEKDDPSIPMTEYRK